MRMVYREDINFQPMTVFQLVLHVDAKFLFIDTKSDGSINAWFEVDNEEPTELRSFALYATGASIRENAKYLGSVIQGELVWHLYELFN
jgi:hypothetical protein